MDNTKCKTPESNKGKKTILPRCPEGAYCSFYFKECNASADGTEIPQECLEHYKEYSHDECEDCGEFECEGNGACGMFLGQPIPDSSWDRDYNDEF